MIYSWYFYNFSKAALKRRFNRFAIVSLAWADSIFSISSIFPTSKLRINPRLKPFSFFTPFPIPLPSFYCVPSDSFPRVSPIVSVLKFLSVLFQLKHTPTSPEFNYTPGHPFGKKRRIDVRITDTRRKPRSVLITKRYTPSWKKRAGRRLFLQFVFRICASLRRNIVNDVVCNLIAIAMELQPKIIIKNGAANFILFDISRGNLYSSI